MKTMNFIAIMAFSATMLIVTACNKEDDFPTAVDYINDITGDYEGTYEQIDGSRSTDTAYAEVRHLGGIEVEVHCYGELLDTTFVMDIYAEHDSIMLCANGTAFENTYGHMKGDDHMNHHGNNSTEWMHHLEDDHDIGDQHFGGFNLSHHSLVYTFRIERNNSIEIVRFEGVRQE